MKLFAFSLFDVGASYFNTPFFFGQKGQAVRAMIELGSDLSTTVGRYPSDFHLYVVGTFDDQTGVLERVAPESLGPVLSFLPKQKPNGLFEERPRENKEDAS